MKVIAINKGYFEKRRRIGEVFDIPDGAFNPEWMADAAKVEQTKTESRPLTLKEMGAHRSDTFVAVMHRKRFVPREPQAEPPVKKGRRVAEPESTLDA